MFYKKAKSVLDTIAYTESRLSQLHGYGLFATENIPYGAVLGVVDGQSVSWEQIKEYNENVEWNALSETHILIRHYPTKYSLINHSRVPNIEFKMDMMNTVKIVTLRPIVSGEELLFDYREKPLCHQYIGEAGHSYL